MVNTRRKTLARNQAEDKILEDASIPDLENINDIDTRLVTLGNIQNRFTAHENDCKSFVNAVKCPRKYQEWHQTSMAAHGQMFQSTADLMSSLITVLGNGGQEINREEMLTILVDKFNKLELEGLNCLIKLKGFQGLFENKEVGTFESVDGSQVGTKTDAENDGDEEGDGGSIDWCDQEDKDSNDLKDSDWNENESCDGEREDVDDFRSADIETLDDRDRNDDNSGDSTDKDEIESENESFSQIINANNWLDAEDADMDDFEITNEADYKKAVMSLKLCEENYNSNIEMLKRSARKRSRSSSSESDSEQSDDTLPQLKRAKSRGISLAKVRKLTSNNKDGTKTRQLDLSHHILAMAAQIRQRDIKSKIKDLEKSLQETEAEIRKSQRNFLKVVTRFIKTNCSKDAFDISQLLDDKYQLPNANNC